MFAPAPALRRSPRLAALNAPAVGVAPPAPAPAPLVVPPPPPPAPAQPVIAAQPVVAAPNPAVAANALALAQPVEHVSVVQCTAEYDHLVLKVDDVERTLQCDRSLIGMWANRSRLQIRRIFDPASSVQIVMAAAKALRVGLETATQYGTAVDAFQNVNLTSIGVAKRALNRLSNAVTPISLHSTQRALQLARLERDLWPALLRKALEVDQGNAVLYAECMLDANSAPIQYFLAPVPIRGNRGRGQPAPAAPIALPPALPQVPPPLPIAVPNPPPAQPVANPVVPAAPAPGPVAPVPAPGPAVAQPQVPLPQPPAPANAPPPPAQGRNRRASSSSVTGSTGSSSDSEDDAPGAGAVALSAPLPVIPQPAPSQAVLVQPLPAQAPQNAPQSGQARRSRSRSSSSASTGRSPSPASITGSSSDADSDDDFPPGGGAAGAAAGTVGDDLSRIESSRTGSDSDGGQNADDAMSNGGADELDDLDMIDGLDLGLMDRDGGAVDGDEMQDMLDGVDIGQGAPNSFDVDGNLFNGSLGSDAPSSLSLHTAVVDDEEVSAEKTEENGDDGESGSGTRAMMTYDGSEGSGETMTAGIEDGSWDYVPSSVDVPLRNNRSLTAESSDPNTVAAQDDMSLSSRTTRETWRHLSNTLSDRILTPLRPAPGTPHTARSPSVQPEAEVPDVDMDSVSTAISAEGSLHTGHSVSVEDSVIENGAVSDEAEAMDSTGQKSEEGGEEQEMEAESGLDTIVESRSGTMEFDDSTGESFSAGVESGSWDYVPSDVDIPVRIRSLESESSAGHPTHANVSQSTSRETRNTWREMSDRLSDRILSPLGSPTRRRIPLYRPYPEPSSRSSTRTASTQSSSRTSVRTAEEAAIRSVVTASLASICSATTAQLPTCVTASEVSLANTAEEISASTARSFSLTDFDRMPAHTPDEFTMDFETAEELEVNGLVSSMSQLSVHTATSGARSPNQGLVQASPSMHSGRKRSSSDEPGEAEGESAEKRRRED